jgi:hypothetical protein
MPNIAEVVNISFFRISDISVLNWPFSLYALLQLGFYKTWVPIFVQSIVYVVVCSLANKIASILLDRLKADKSGAK